MKASARYGILAKDPNQLVYDRMENEKFHLPKVQLETCQKLRDAYENKNKKESGEFERKIIALEMQAVYENGGVWVITQHWNSVPIAYFLLWTYAFEESHNIYGNRDYFKVVQFEWLVQDFGDHAGILKCWMKLGVKDMTNWERVNELCSNSHGPSKPTAGSHSTAKQQTPITQKTIEKLSERLKPCADCLLENVLRLRPHKLLGKWIPWTQFGHK